jgi:hypothetical protein
MGKWPVRPCGIVAGRWLAAHDTFLGAPLTLFTLQFKLNGSICSCLDFNLIWNFRMLEQEEQMYDWWGVVSTNLSRLDEPDTFLGALLILLLLKSQGKLTHKQTEAFVPQASRGVCSDLVSYWHTKPWSGIAHPSLILDPLDHAWDQHGFFPKPFARPSRRRWRCWR